MKGRTGFVSNSSSASFMVQWRFRSLGVKHTITRALSLLFGVYTYNNETDIVDWDSNWTDNDVHKDLFEYVKNKSVLNSDGSFTTLFSTSMLNSYEDFGTIAQLLVFALIADEKFEIIDTKIERDSEW